MAQIALHLALSCSSRHYAGRSLQVRVKFVSLGIFILVIFVYDYIFIFCDPNYSLS